MDKLHNEMVRQMEETEEMEVQEKVTEKPSRKVSVSTACQTEKVSRKVSHVARFKESVAAGQPGEEMTRAAAGQQEMTPVTRATSRTSTERGETEGVVRLRECNDVLLSFIDKARVLAQAEVITASIPTVLTDKVSVSFNVEQVAELFEEEINKLKMKISETERSQREKMMELKMLEEENTILRLSHERNREELSLKERELTELDLMEAELEYKIGVSNAMVVERIRYLEGEIAECQAQLRESEMAFEKMEENRVNDNLAAPDIEKIVEMPASMGANRQDEALELIIKIRNEYLQRMKEVLDKVRLEYRDDYERFIKKMERETDELLNCISSLMTARMEKTTAATHYSSLLELERMRNYEVRIRDLQADAHLIMERIKDKDNHLDRLSAHYRSERISVDVELEKLKVKLEKLLEQFTMFAKCKLQDTKEVEIYSKLLDFENERLSTEKQEYKVTVRESSSRSSTRAVAGSVLESDKEETKPRRESGYKSEGDKSQDDTLELPRDSFLGDLASEVY